MVERTIQLNNIFSSLADGTRRDILRRVAKRERSISELAKPYKISFAAIAKHVQVLEMANLVHKRREGKQQIISVVPKTFKVATTHIEEYEKIWDQRFSSLDALLEK